MDKLFQLMADKKATDLFLSVGAPITIKMQGNSVPVNPAVLDMKTVRSLLEEVLKADQLEEFDREKELQTRCVAQGVGVFRLSCFYQRGTPALVAEQFAATGGCGGEDEFHEWPLTPAPHRDRERQNISCRR
jgi:twitching motility protein PilU